MAGLNIRSLTVSIVIALVMACCLEIVVWLGLTYPTWIPPFMLQAFRTYYLSQDRSIIQVTECARYDPELFYTLNPGTCTFANREFSVQNVVNHAGIRDDHQSLQGPSIVVLGDSYAMGWGVRQEEAFPQVLEGLSQRPVLNAGISSYGTAREMILLGRLNTSDLKYLIIQYHRNDYVENRTFIENNYRLPIRSKLQYDSLKDAISKRIEYFPFKYTAGLTKSLLKTALQPPAPDTTNSLHEAQIFLDILSRGVPPRDSLTVIIFRADLPDRLKKDKFVSTLDSLIKTEPYAWPNIVTFDAREILKDEDYFVLDDHINAQGHRKLASHINQFIKEAPRTVGTRILVKDEH